MLASDKFWKLYTSLSKPKQKHFRRWMESLDANNQASGRITRLFYGLNGREKQPDDELLWQSYMEGKAFDARRLMQDVSALSIVLEDFLLWEQIRNDTVKRRIALFSVYKQYDLAGFAGYFSQIQADFHRKEESKQLGVSEQLAYYELLQEYSITFSKGKDFTPQLYETFFEKWAEDFLRMKLNLISYSSLAKNKDNTWLKEQKDLLSSFSVSADFLQGIVQHFPHNATLQMYLQIIELCEIKKAPDVNLEQIKELMRQLREYAKKFPSSLHKLIDWWTLVKNRSMVWRRQENSLRITKIIWLIMEFGIEGKWIYANDYIPFAVWASMIRSASIVFDAMPQEEVYTSILGYKEDVEHRPYDTPKFILHYVLLLWAKRDYASLSPILTDYYQRSRGWKEDIFRIEMTLIYMKHQYTRDGEDDIQFDSANFIASVEKDRNLLTISPSTPTSKSILVELAIWEEVVLANPYKSAKKWRAKRDAYIAQMKESPDALHDRNWYLLTLQGLTT